MTAAERHENIHRFHHRLNSTFGGVNDTVGQLSDFIKEIELETNLFALMYLVREALNNAVIHGNKMDPDKEVHIDVQVEDSDISITISDEGEGFHWRQISSLVPVQPEETSGRGIYSLQQYGYSMRYNDKGNILYLSKEVGH